MIGELAFAVTAGTVATVNPCGFALLPAYLARRLGAEDDGGTRRDTAIARALSVGAATTLGFVRVFGARCGGEQAWRKIIGRKGALGSIPLIGALLIAAAAYAAQPSGSRSESGSPMMPMGTGMMMGPSTMGQNSMMGMK